MKTTMAFALFLAMGSKSYCQKLYVAPNLGMHLGSWNYFPSSDRPARDFKSPRAQLIYTLGFNVYYNQRNLTHKLGVQSTSLGMNYKVLQEPPYALFGGGYNIHSSWISHAIISYSLQKEQRVSKKFIGATSIKLKGALGVGFSPNRSQGFYDSTYNINSAYWVYQTGDFWGHDYPVPKKQAGFFLMPEIGFDLFSKSGKRFLQVEFFYWKGLRKMQEFNVSYFYGNLNNNTRIDQNQVVRTRGTQFGLKIGVPIGIIKKD